MYGDHLSVGNLLVKCDIHGTNGFENDSHCTTVLTFIGKYDVLKIIQEILYTSKPLKHTTNVHTFTYKYTHTPTAVLKYRFVLLNAILKLQIPK